MNNNMGNDLKKATEGVSQTLSGAKKILKMGYKIMATIAKMAKMAISIMKSIFSFFVSLGPIGLIILGILMIVFSFIGWYTWGNKGMEENTIMSDKKENAIFFTQDDLKIIGVDFNKEGHLTYCENLEDYGNIYTSQIGELVEKGYKSEEKMMANLCFYHLILTKKVNGDFDTEEINEDIDKNKIKINKLRKSINPSKNTKKINKIEEEIIKLNSKKDIISKINKVFDFKGFDPEKYKRYSELEDYEYGYKGQYNFPENLFSQKEKFIFLMYYYYIGNRYGQNFGESVEIKKGVFVNGTIDNISWNTTDELLFDFLNGHEKLTDFINEISNESDYYNYTCKPCKKEKCSCTGDPEEDYNKEFDEDEAKDMLRSYKEYIVKLMNKNVIYVTYDIKPPFRNYTDEGNYCKVDVVLTQRDGPSDLSFGSFTGYPVVDGKKTHAGLDIVGKKDCEWEIDVINKNVPVFSMTDGEVVLVTYSPTAWGNRIIIKSIIGGSQYFFQYSHLKDKPSYEVGSFVTSDDILGVQGKSGPSTGKHLDLTIYDGARGEIMYSNYLRNTLGFSGMGIGYGFEDLFLKENMINYNVNSYINSSYN